MSLRLNPRDPTSPLAAGVAVTSYYFEHDYKAAAEAASCYLANYPVHPAPRRMLVAALGQLGRTNEAHEALRLAISQGGFGSYVHSRPPWFRAEDHEHMLDGLRKAGWEG